MTDRRSGETWPPPPGVPHGALPDYLDTAPAAPPAPALGGTDCASTVPDREPYLSRTPYLVGQPCWLDNYHEGNHINRSLVSIVEWPLTKEEQTAAKSYRELRELNGGATIRPGEPGRGRRVLAFLAFPGAGLTSVAAGALADVDPITALALAGPPLLVGLLLRYAWRAR